MKIVNTPPPNYEEIDKVFHVKHRTVAFTYGDTVYNPSGHDIPPHVLVHESIHVKQQGQNPKAWWDLYLVNPEFRLSQELEAYRAQYKHLQHEIKDRNLLTKFLHFISSDLASDMYGKLLPASEAMERIKA